MKRILSLLLVVSLCVGMFTGCGTSDRNSDEVQGTEKDTAGMVHLDSDDAVKSFIEEVYARAGADYVPDPIDIYALDLGDEQTVNYNTGLSDYSQIESITLSESMITSLAYSLIYIRTKDGSDPDAIISTLMENINPAKWLCVEAEKQLAVKFGDDIFYIMASEDAVNAIYDAAAKLAEEKGMKVSETVIKINPI